MNPAPPSNIFWFIVVIAFWAFYGLAGRDAWRHEEVMALAPILDWLDGAVSLWATPAPLYTWVAGNLARLGLTGIAGIDAQDGARLASGLFTLLAMAFTGLAARALFGAGFGPVAALALLGAFGLMLLSHALLPEAALLAAWAALLYGVSIGHVRPGTGVVAIGLALAALTLGMRGFPDLAIGVLIVLLPLLSPAWRSSEYLRASLFGLTLAAMVIAATLYALRAAGLLEVWLAGHGYASPRVPDRAYTELAWFAWPLWPLALAAIWHEHRRLGRAIELHMPLIALALLLAAALFPAWSRDGALLPALLPLALLAAYAVDILRRGAANAFYWFGVLCFLFFGFAFWLYFAAIEWGIPAHMAERVARLTPNYQPGSVDRFSLGVAVALTLGWLVAIPLFPRAKSRPILVWATGMVLVWGLIAALYRPWIEAGWGYRPLLEDMARHLPAEACLDARVDPAMAVMLRYHTRHPARQDCPWLLLAVDRKAAEQPAPPNRAEVVWEGQRPRQKALGYVLYHARP